MLKTAENVENIVENLLKTFVLDHYNNNIIYLLLDTNPRVNFYLSYWGESSFLPNQDFSHHPSFFIAFFFNHNNNQNMILELDDFCAKVAPKLLKLIPYMTDCLEKRKIALENGEEFCGGVILIEGSRGSGKTQGMIRIVGQLLMNGYADAATIGIITEKSLDESVCALFTNVFDEHIDWPSVRTGDMYYPLQDGGEVFFKGFHPSRGSALKTNERAKDILFVDEVENWKGGASATLNTYIRACGLIILVSNHFSQDVKDWAKAFNAQYIRIDYWENPALPKYVLDGWNQLKIENYDLWRATIMYDDTDQFKRIITDAEIFSCFDPYTPAKAYRVGVMGIDVAIGGGDCSVMCCAYLDQRDHIVLDIRDGTKAETMALIGSVVLNKAKWRANFEIWDGDGQGKAVIQTRAPGTNAERQQKGIYEFHGGIGGNQTWGDNRTMGYGTLAQFAREGRLHFVGDRNALEKLQEDLRAQILTDPRKYGQVQLAMKSQVKKILGRSPDYSDSAMMAVWFLVHKAMKEYGGVQHEDHTYKKALQVVNNSRYNTRK